MGGGRIGAGIRKKRQRKKKKKPKLNNPKQ